MGHGSHAFYAIILVCRGLAGQCESRKVFERLIDFYSLFCTLVRRAFHFSIRDRNDECGSWRVDCQDGTSVSSINSIVTRPSEIAQQRTKQVPGPCWSLFASFARKASKSPLRRCCANLGCAGLWKGRSYSVRTCTVASWSVEMQEFVGVPADSRRRWIGEADRACGQRGVRCSYSSTSPRAWWLLHVKTSHAQLCEHAV